MAAFIRSSQVNRNGWTFYFPLLSTTFLSFIYFAMMSGGEKAKAASAAWFVLSFLPVIKFGGDKRTRNEFLLPDCAERIFSAVPISFLLLLRKAHFLYFFSLSQSFPSLAFSAEMTRESCFAFYYFFSFFLFLPFGAHTLSVYSNFCEENDISRHWTQIKLVSFYRKKQKSVWSREPMIRWMWD